MSKREKAKELVEKMKAAIRRQKKVQAAAKSKP